jgi:hypothetical protein
MPVSKWPKFIMREPRLFPTRMMWAPLLIFNKDEDDSLQLKENTDMVMAVKTMNTAFVEFIFIT